MPEYLSSCEDDLQVQKAPLPLSPQQATNNLTLPFMHKDSRERDFTIGKPL